MHSFTFLGTGTSLGVPVIGCTCSVCTSSNARDKRLRAAGLVKLNDKNYIIDAGPDFRQQLLRAQVTNVEAILITHEHSDHTAGLDDVRPLNFINKNETPLYATQKVEADIRRRFAYAFDENPYPGAPQISFVRIAKENNFYLNGTTVTPIEVSHGLDMKVLGFRFHDFTYITDCKTIAPEELEKVRGTRFLVLNALHYNPHHSHLNIPEAIELAQKIGAEKTFFTHINHRLGKHEDVQKTLPPRIFLAYDGLTIDF